MKLLVTLEEGVLRKIGFLFDEISVFSPQEIASAIFKEERMKDHGNKPILSK